MLTLLQLRDQHHEILCELCAQQYPAEPLGPTDEPPCAGYQLGSKRVHCSAVQGAQVLEEGVLEVVGSLPLSNFQKFQEN